MFEENTYVNYANYLIWTSLGGYATAAVAGIAGYAISQADDEAEKILETAGHFFTADAQRLRDLILQEEATEVGIAAGVAFLLYYEYDNWLWGQYKVQSEKRKKEWRNSEWF